MCLSFVNILTFSPRLADWTAYLQARSEHNNKKGPFCICFTVYVVFIPGHPSPCAEACSAATATWASWVGSAPCSPAPSLDLSRLWTARAGSKYPALTRARQMRVSYLQRMRIRNVLLHALACGESGAYGDDCQSHIFAALSRNEL